MADTYSITELAREFSITPRTIRHYENEGLLAPDRNGTTRLFSPKDRSRLKIALRSTRLGLTLAEIKRLFDLYDSVQTGTGQPQEFLTVIAHYRKQLEQQRADAGAMLEEIAFFEKQCKKSLKP